MNGTLNLTKSGLNVQLTGEITPAHLQELNSLIINFSSQQEHFDIFPEISDELKSNKDFLDIKNILLKEYEEHYTKYTRINHNLELIQQDNKLLLKVKPNLEDLRKKLNTLLNNILTKNIGFVLIHTSGNFCYEEHEKMYHSIKKKFSTIPDKHITTKRNTNRALIEIIIFGEDIVKEDIF